MRRNRSRYPFKFEERCYNYAFKIIRGLYDIPRTGWVDRGVDDPETIGDHNDALIIMAKKLYPNISGLSKMLEIHAWPKYMVKDIRTDLLCLDSGRLTPQKKYERELEAMKEICAHLDETGKVILSLWLEFKENQTTRAKVANQLKSLQMILKAIEYQKQGTMVMAQEFIDYDGDKIRYRKLRKILEEAVAEIS